MRSIYFYIKGKRMRKKNKKRTTFQEKQFSGNHIDTNLFIKIPLKSIKMQDAYEQVKFERMKAKSVDAVIKHLERFFDDSVILISFNQ